MPLRPLTHYSYTARQLALVCCTCLLVIGAPIAAFAQFEVNNANEPPYDPVRLIEDVFLGEGVDVINIQFEGETGAIGHFQGGMPHVGIEEGIVLTTGRVETSGAQYGINSTSNLAAVYSNNSTATDAHINQIVNGDPADASDIFDVSKFTITFVPKGDQVKFKYVFASEEYPEFVCSDYNDIFGFFLEGPGMAGPFPGNAENIALIPGTTLPVSINTVNPGVNGLRGSPTGCDPPAGSLAYSTYYVDNSGAGNQPVFNGMTTVLVAEATVVPCQTYTMTMSIGDITDPTFDSGVFLEAKSFSTPSLDVQVATLSLAGEVAEGCEAGEFVFSVNEALPTDRTITYTVGGTATPSADYAPLSGTIVLPAGALDVRIPVLAFEDGLAEGVETISITVDIDPCSTQTVELKLVDRSLPPVPLAVDTAICPGEMVDLDGTIATTVDSPVTFTNNNFELITFHNTSYWKDINVVGIDPVSLRGGLVLEICMTLSHNRTEDLDLYLYSPDGNYIELSTDNGGNNPGGYQNLCFRSDATDRIDVLGGSAPLTGNFLPEGRWADLWDRDGSNANGTWRLQIIDDMNSQGGTFSEWSITFAPVYNIEYEWTPSAGLSCVDCPNPEARPTATTTYTLIATDSYGCTEVADARIEIFEPTLAPMLSCAPGFDELTWSWPSDPLVTSYEIRVDGGAWVDIATATIHTETGLSFGQSVQLEVRANGPCNQATASESCMTQACSPYTITATPVDASCAFGSDGEVSLSANGGVSSWTYTLNTNSNTTGTFTGLVEGNYTATSLDANGCAGTVDFTIGAPTATQTVASYVRPSACGDDYQVSVAASGGAGAPYTYAWTGGATTAATTYPAQGGMVYVEVRDMNGCPVTDSLLLPAIQPLSAVWLVDSIDCNSGVNGRLDVTLTGGVAPYTYDIGAGPTSMSSFSNFAVGTYTYTVRDSFGCTLDTTITLVDPAPLEVVLELDEISCFGESDGNIRAVVTGGTGSYQYLWNTTSTDSSLTDIGAGTYQVRVMDRNACIVRATVVFSGPGELAVVLEPQNAACKDDPSGQIQARTMGGTAPFTFTWSTGAVTTDSLLTDLAPGRYGVSILDSNGCVALADSVTIAEPTGITVSSTAQPITCAGANNGEINVTVSGGTPPYSFTWLDGPTTEDRTGLAAGTYTVSIEDQNACPQVYDVIIDEAPPLLVDMTSTDVSCFGFADGRITTVVNGGQAPYTFSWTGPAGYAFFGADPTMLDTGAYVLVLRDNFGCQFDTTIQIVQPGTIVLSVVAGDSICFGASDATAEVTVIGGTASFSYLWDNGETDAIAVALTAGTRSVAVTDANGCTFSEQVEIESLPEITLQLDESGVSCFSDSNGIARVVSVLYGGSPRDTSGLTYVWDGDINDVGTSYDSLGGTQAVMVVATDGRGCQAAQSITITSPAELRTSVRKLSDLNCFNSGDGSAEVVVVGGTPSYTFEWLTATATPDAQVISDLAAGTHQVAVVDANGCLDTASVSLLQPDSLQTTFDIIEVNCFDRNSGVATANVFGGTSPYRYAWSNGSNTSAIDRLQADNYSLLVTDVNGCTVIDTARVTPASDVVLSGEVIGVTCNGDIDGEIILSAEGGRGPLEYAISGISWNRFGNFRYLEPGDYWGLAQDRDGCPSDTLYFEVEEPLPLRIDAGDVVSVDLGDDAEITAEVYNAQGEVSFEWLPNDDDLFSCTTCSTTTVTPTFQGFVTVSVVDSRGCEAEDGVRLSISKELQVMVPTGFTPNADGNNDLLLVHGKSGTEVVTFEVFNRWGDKVYMAENFRVNSQLTGWDGRMSDKYAPAGVYIWSLKVRYLDGIEATLAGQTTLIR